MSAAKHKRKHPKIDNLKNTDYYMPSTTPETSPEYNLPKNSVSCKKSKITNIKKVQEKQSNIDQEFDDILDIFIEISGHINNSTIIQPIMEIHTKDKKEGFQTPCDIPLDFQVTNFDINDLKEYLEIPEQVDLNPVSVWKTNPETGKTFFSKEYKNINRYNKKKNEMFIQKVIEMTTENVSQRQQFTNYRTNVLVVPKLVFGILFVHMNSLWTESGKENNYRSSSVILKNVQELLPKFPESFIQCKTMNPISNEGNRTHRKMYPVWIIPFVIHAMTQKFPEKFQETPENICSKLLLNLNLCKTQCRTQGLSNQFKKQLDMYTIAFEHYKSIIQNKRFEEALSQLSKRVYEEKNKRVSFDKDHIRSIAHKRIDEWRSNKETQIIQKLQQDVKELSQGMTLLLKENQDAMREMMQISKVINNLQTRIKKMEDKEKENQFQQKKCKNKKYIMI